MHTDIRLKLKRWEGVRKKRDAMGEELERKTN